ncbi:hypothetical protein C0J26_11630 [Pseudomonas baetica]|uniref:transposase n=1 Tax=Pseudomonas baetica TaxID=674054 RepID=UPI000D1E0744|nr:transposase [Pseudomonas baetica]PTC19079.1 hypothetical protein C0J26_11630 [Pseudomonas baetica]
MRGNSDRLSRCTESFSDARRSRSEEEGLVRNKAIYLALGVLPDGMRDILGIWIGKHRGCEVLDEGLQHFYRGVEDVLIAVTDVCL